MEIGADALVYQDLDALKDSVRALNPALTCFDTSCFDGKYITGDVTAEYLDQVENGRGNKAKAGSGEEDSSASQQMDLNLVDNEAGAER